MLYNDSVTADEACTHTNASSSAHPSLSPLPPLQDRFGRTFDYIRIGVTEKCNLRCTYCMPEEGVDFKGGEKILYADEITRVVNTLSRMGIKKVRFTGGEPLVRKDIMKMVEGVASTPGIKSVHMTTNGILFAKYAQSLKDAGMTGLNISLDSLDAERFQRITRRTGLEKVLESIDQAVDMGFPRVKVNVVVMRGFNEDEIPQFCELTKDKPITVRFIEFMPIDDNQIWENGEHFASAEDMVNQIQTLYPGVGDSNGTRTEHHIFQVPGYAGKVAVIPAFTRSLCGNCSRIRLTSDGKVRNCLYSDDEYDIRELIREGGSDDDIVSVFRQAFADKAKDGFESKKQSTVKRVNVGDIGRTSMTQIGG